MADTINAVDAMGEKKYAYSIEVLDSTHEGNFQEEYSDNGRDGVVNVVAHNATFDAMLEDRFMKETGNSDEDILAWAGKHEGEKIKLGEGGVRHRVAAKKASVVYTWTSSGEHNVGTWNEYWSSNDYTVQGMSDSGRLIAGVRFRNPSWHNVTGTAENTTNHHTANADISHATNNASMTYLSEVQIFNAGLNFDNGVSGGAYVPWGKTLTYVKTLPIAFQDLSLTRDGCFMVLATSYGVKVYGSNERVLPFASMPDTYKERVYAMKDARAGRGTTGGASKAGVGKTAKKQPAGGEIIGDARIGDGGGESVKGMNGQVIPGAKNGTGNGTGTLVQGNGEYVNNDYDFARSKLDIEGVNLHDGAVQARKKEQDSERHRQFARRGTRWTPKFIVGFTILVVFVLCMFGIEYCCQGKYGMFAALNIKRSGLGNLLQVGGGMKGAGELDKMRNSRMPGGAGIGGGQSPGEVLLLDIQFSTTTI